MRQIQESSRSSRSSECSESSESIIHQSASNLAFSFIILPPQTRKSIGSLYAFCRKIDDIADADSLSENQRRQRLTDWRSDLLLAFSGGNCQIPVNQELKPIIEKHRLPFQLFDELLKGVESDLSTFRYETDEDLQAYCYRVASVVGLLSIEIFGYQNPKCRDYAIHLGFALQYTNILRDVWSDAKRGRIYLPIEDLERFGIAQNEILSGQHSERFVKLGAEIASRARGFYVRAAASLPSEDRPSLIAAEMMARIYWELLRKLEKRHFDVFNKPRIRVSKTHKILLLMMTWISIHLKIGHPPFQIKKIK